MGIRKHLQKQWQKNLLGKNRIVRALELEEVVSQEDGLQPSAVGRSPASGSTVLGEWRNLLDA